MISVETHPTASEAARALGDRTRYLAGGTLVMRAVNYGDQSFDRIVHTPDPALKEIRQEGGRLSIGAGVTMAEIIAHPNLAFLAPAARSVGGPAIRNMATVGGNLFAPHPYGDLATALLALDASARLADGTEMPLDQLFARRRGLPNVVLAITLPSPAPRTFRFGKMSRVKPKGVSVMTMAVHAPSGSAPRVAYGAMADIPVRVPPVERALAGLTSFTEANIAPALAAATEGLDPPTDALASAWYRREVAPVYLKRLLLGEAI
ncbi:MAG: FAD binding domain-containing protein [Pseudomonadota bacterium]